ncbi:GSCOCG00002250001-RA-CDS, partial [Cotesia congregata]
MMDSGEEIVISGIAGRFPESNNMQHFQDNLFNKVDLVTDDDRRWKLDHPEIPQRTGKINNVGKFDALFFGVHFKQAHTMDPMCRMLMEHAFEAIVDAGVNPRHLRGTKTGVFIGACFSESEKTWFYEKLQVNGFGITGCSRAMLANRLSYWLGVTGPSYTVDSACSSSLFAMEHAYRAIRNGQCDAALVGGANLCLHPYVSLQFSRLGVLSADGRCKSFDADANGYTRSETVSIAFLQKAKDAKRIYATIIHGKTNCDGFKEQGITFPSSAMQSVLLHDFYEECKIPPSIVNYIEAHGTGTKVGDPEEVNAIDIVFCPGRTEPLRIGSIKSNLGHAEPASGMCSIAKVVIANETGIIPPNLHYNRPREGVKALEEGRVKVITDPTPWEGGYVGVSSFGFGGANAHILLKSNPIEKVNGGAPNDDLPRLVVVESRPIDVEYVRLLQDIYTEDIPGHLYRGYTILSRHTTKENRIRDTEHYPGAKRPIWFVFSGMGSQWPGMGTALLRFPVFAQAIKKCDAVLKPRGVDIYDILTNPNKSTFDNILNSFVGIAAVQIGLVDLLTSLGIVPDRIIGHSVGELGCAYADGCFTAEQMVLAAYSRGLASIETKTIFGSMAAVGLGYEDVKDLSGPKLLKYLKEVIPDPKPRSPKWLSTSVPRSQWTTPQARLSSAEYHTNNLLNAVLFEETANLIPKDAVTIEIAPHGLLQAILRRSLSPSVTNIPLTQRGHKDNVEVFLQAVGKIYDVGYLPQIANLYPDIKFPVSRGTPMISPLIKWEHSDDWYVTSYRMQEKITSGERTVEVTLSDEDYEYMSGHVIDGRNLLPATGYLALVWETIGMMKGELYTEGTGRFEVVEGGAAVVTGYVHYTNKPALAKLNPPPPEDEEEEMTAKDVYKELRLRGYQYSGSFRGIKSASTSGMRGKIAWINNWVAFMDNMLQMQILEMDSRGLFVPTSIQKLVIDTKTHLNQIRAMPDDVKEFPVFRNKTLDLIVAGGVEIRGLKASVIGRRKPAGEPVLESYQFIAHRDRSEMSLQQVIRAAVHLALENHQEIKVKTLENLEANEKYPVEDLFTPILQEVLGDIPLIQADLNILTENSFEEDKLPQNINVTEAKKLPPDANAIILTGRDLLSKEKTASLSQLLFSLKDGGFILTLESSKSSDYSTAAKRHNLDVLVEKVVGSSLCLLLRKQDKLPKKSIIVTIASNSFNWIDELKSILEREKEGELSHSRVILVSEKSFESGLLGLVNCLRKEPGGEIIRGVLIQDEKAPDFSLSLPLYGDQMKLDLALNVLRPNKTWGSYRHLQLPAVVPRPVHHAWGPIQPGFEHPDLVDVVYSAINFRDIMLASGKLAAEIVATNRALEECCIGFEYSGIDRYGKKVMGIIPSRALTNKTVIDRNLSWYVPDGWTLEDAATVPCVYATVYNALYIFGKMKKGHKILIHSGSGGTGQAAITLALNEGCEVFTTVGTPEKRKFIRDNFPQIPEDHIGNSRDTSFETMILERTNGRGVDIVLNSLADDKLQASIRCLGNCGQFLEIGKFDMVNDTPIGMAMFLKEISFHGVLLDLVFNAPVERKRELRDFLQKGLDSGIIKPLTRTVFPKEKLEAAYRYMAAGKHIGKVVVKVLDENDLQNTLIPGLPRYHCFENRSYVILGGLGGFGLELADWLVLRGARNLVLTSRSGLKNGYQRMRVRLWKSYGVKVEIVAGKNPANHQECEDILKLAENLAPVDGIFNLAVVLKDSLIENQTPDTFKESFTAKAWTTKVLDKVSRIVCPKLRHFVVFSSVSCGRGNAGQSNYGMSNSVMERICEKRVAEGLPALAVQWGAVGDVGLVADMQEDNKELVIGGTLQQRITSCLQELNYFLMQSHPIVSSMVVAEKRAGGAGALNIVDTVLNIM